MNKFTFDEKKHLYYLDGKPLTGCTTVLSVIAKPTLIQWAANMAVDYIQEIFTSGKDLNDDIFKEARTVHRKKKEKAGSVGTDTHKIIEYLIKFAITNNQGFLSEGVDENKLVENFRKWAIKNKVQFLESEKRMFSKKYWVGGTCDFTCIIDNKKYVGDIKTSNGIYGREPFAQTACYRMMLEEMGEAGFEGSIIINIKKNGIFNENEDVHLSLYYKDDLELFLAALKIYRIINNFKQN